MKKTLKSSHSSCNYCFCFLPCNESPTGQLVIIVEKLDFLISHNLFNGKIWVVLNLYKSYIQIVINMNAFPLLAPIPDPIYAI